MPQTFKFEFTVPDGKVADVKDLLTALSTALEFGVEGATTPAAARDHITPTPPLPTVEKTGPKVASVNQIAAIHAIYIDIGKKTGKTLNKEERIVAVRAMLNLTSLDSIDNLTSWQASKVITALKSSQGNTGQEPF